MKRVLWLFFTSLLPSAAMASSVVVKSGEHEAFSRLVFYYEEYEVSHLIRKEDVVVFSLSSSISEADSSSVFDFIPAQRVKNVLLKDGKLKIELGCECEVEFVRYAAGVSYLDVRDYSLEAGLAPRGGQPEGDRSIRELYNPKQVPYDLGLDSLVSNVSQAALHGRGYVSNWGASMRDDGFDESKWLREFFLTALEEQVNNFPEGSAIDGFRSESIPRSADALLFSFDDFDSNFPSLNYVKSKDGSGFQGMQGESICRSSLSENLLDFSISEEGFEHDISAARSSMVNSNFQMEGRSAGDLVRIYISMGMIEESKFFLDFVEPSQDKAALDLIISFLMAVGDDGSPNVSRFECIEGGFFWSAVMGESVKASSEVLPRIFSYFRSFPRGLRELTLPRFRDFLDRAGVGRGVSLLDFGEEVSTPNKEAARGKVNFATEEVLLHPRRVVLSTSYGKDEFDQRERFLSLDGYPVDRVMWEGIAHSLRGSELQALAWGNLLDSHLNVLNWVAGAEVIETAARAGYLSIAGKLLNERFFPQLLEKGSVGDIFLFYQEDRFVFLVGLLGARNKSLLNRRVLASASDLNDSMDGPVVEVIEDGRSDDTGSSSLLRQSSEGFSISNGVALSDFSRLLSESQTLKREAEALIVEGVSMKR